MAKDLVDALFLTIRVIESVGRTVEFAVGAIEKISEANSRKSQEKKYDVEWIDIKKTEWIDVNCKNNKKLYDVNGNIIVIGKPSPKIHTMATYDMNGNLIEDSPVKVKKAAKKVIFMDVRDKKDERGKLKKLYRDGYLSKSRYNSLMKDLNK
ncbi:MAG: hypothetical protein ACJZ2N_01240 [Candidatus Poseidoniales archaeon]